MKRDDYIIRLYRRSSKDRRMVVGTVEQVGGRNLKMSFSDFEELRLILCIPRGPIPRKAPSGSHPPAEEISCD